MGTETPLSSSGRTPGSAHFATAATMGRRSHCGRRVASNVPDGPRRLPAADASSSAGQVPRARTRRRSRMSPRCDRLRRGEMGAHEGRERRADPFSARHGRPFSAAQAGAAGAAARVTTSITACPIRSPSGRGPRGPDPESASPPPATSLRSPPGSSGGTRCDRTRVFTPRLARRARILRLVWWERMLRLSVVAWGTLATRRSTAAEKKGVVDEDVGPLASAMRLSDGAVSPEMTIDRSGPSKRYAKAGTTGGWSPALPSP